MASVEMVVRDRDVRGRSRRAGLDGNVVVAGVDEAMRNGDVGGAGGIDAVGVRAVCGESIATPQAVNPSPLNQTWKLGEFRSVMRYRVNRAERESAIRRGQF